MQFYCKSMVGVLLVIASSAMGQTVPAKKTIDITSSFKPTLMPPQKLKFTASAAPNDSVRPALRYNLPVQQLAFTFIPAALKPISFSDTLLLPTNKAYIKVGYGNFASPFVKAVAALGNGTKSAGVIDANYLSAKGKLPYQQFAQYGTGIALQTQGGDNHSLQIRGGFQRHETNRYGYQPATLIFPKDSMQWNYNTLRAGVTFANVTDDGFGLQYKIMADGCFFTDNNGGKASAFRFAAPLEKKINEKAAAIVSINGLLNSYAADTNFNNQLVQVKAGARFAFNDKVLVTALLVPSWSNKEFALLPDIGVEVFLNSKNIVIQAGTKGSFIENTYQSLAATNPWLAQPTQIFNSKNLEFYGAVKAIVDEYISFRVKAGYEQRDNVPLWVNDARDGRNFELLWEPFMQIIGLTGEMTWQKGDAFNWYNTVNLSAFAGLDVADKAYGWVPASFQSTFTAKIIRDFYVKADFTGFSPAFYRNKTGTSTKGMRGYDLHLGGEFKVTNGISVWVNFNNVLNQQYERWNQYKVLGFQAQGGAIFQL